MSDRAVIRRFAWVGIVVPGILTALALSAQLRWLPDTPNPIAVHWGSGGADGSGPRWVFPLLTLMLGFGMSAWLWCSALRRLRRGARGWSFRFLAAMALGMAAFGTVAMSYSVKVQVGLVSWQDAPQIAGGLLIAAAIGAVAGLMGWLVQPKQTAMFQELPTPSVELADSERAVWLGAVRSGAVLVAVLVIGIVLVAAGAVAFWVVANYAAMIILAALAMLLTVLALTMLEADVRVDSGGVDVRGPAGLPRIRVPLDNVASAQAVNIEAIGSFGGFGWRRIPGAQGVIMRSGEALRVERKEGPALVITVDDAATAAALLDALKARA